MVDLGSWNWFILLSKLVMGVLIIVFVLMVLKLIVIFFFILLV